MVNAGHGAQTKIVSSILLTRIYFAGFHAHHTFNSGVLSALSHPIGFSQIRQMLLLFFTPAMMVVRIICTCNHSAHLLTKLISDGGFLSLSFAACSVICEHVTLLTKSRNGLYFFGKSVFFIQTIKQDFGIASRILVDDPLKMFIPVVWAVALPAVTRSFANIKWCAVGFIPYIHIISFFVVQYLLPAFC